MRRWLIVFLLTVLPVQLSWAAMASYCQHDAAPAKAAHFGHHEHEHDHQRQAGSGGDGHPAKAKTASSSGDTQTTLALDNDCSFCHLGCTYGIASSVTCTSALITSPQVPPHSAPLYDSHVPQGPERPDRRLA